MSTLCILWDESHIWGLLVWRAVQSLGLPHVLVRAADIAQGALSRKTPEYPLLVAPGGVARRKAEKLGQEGMREIRDFVARGGKYLGFCGGAGLGLSGEYGLGLCPWERAKVRDRMQHLVSGHIRLDIDPDNELAPPGMPGEGPQVPVWWPARFDARDGDGGVRVLGRYAEPGEDFWLADLPLKRLPKGTFSSWRRLYNVELNPGSMAGQPCLLEGDYGQGRYVLSYTHLETPNSPQANRWLYHIVGTFTGRGGLGEGTETTVPPWHLGELVRIWKHPALVLAREVLDEIIRLGRDHFLLFDRNCWLLGWRAGIPGAALNNMYSLLCQSMSLKPTDEAEAFLEGKAGQFMETLEHFRDGVTGYLLAERLAMTLSKSYPDAVPQKGLIRQRNALFGHAMEQGGMYAELLEVLDELIWLQLKDGADISGTVSNCTK